jgi:proteasome lid subunit RPN8/RPN11
LVVPRPLFDGMVAQALSERPNECCGFLVGVLEGGVGTVLRRFPLVNEAASPAEYHVAGHSLCAAHREMREYNLEVLAIYHSHPTSWPVPSRRDLELNYWPGVVSLIISLASESPLVRGWWLGESDYHEAHWMIQE